MKIEEIKLKNIKEGGVFVQIGTNVANDFFTSMCMKFKPSKILLVEPHSTLNSKIEKCYDGFNYSIENVVVSNNDGTIRLYNNPHTNHTQHYSVKPMKDWSDLSVFIDCESISFKKLMEKHNITQIDFLNIDTEGNDAVILDSIDFNSIKIDSILYEWWGFTNECYTDNNHLNGKNGMNFIKGKLNSFGFDVSDVYDNNILTDQFAIKMN
jgi:FkbM family methyltransferase